MNILAIETSCDETAAAIVKDGRQIISNVVYSQIPTHALYGGVVPELASRSHIEQIDIVVNKAISDANISKEEIDAIAVTFAPGLIGSLLIGVGFAKSFAYALSKPLIPVHHIRGHIAALYIAHHNLSPPFTTLVVSGGHSHIIKVIDYTNYKILGRTRDDAAGEVFDKAAKVLGLSYPGGATIDRLAYEGDKNAFRLPRVSFADAPYDFSFSGVKTALINLVHTRNQNGEQINVPDVCASFCDAVTEVLADKLMAAASFYNEKKVAIAGGVSANSHLRQKLKVLCEKQGIELYLAPLDLCTDNAAFIGAQAYYEYLSGNIAQLDLNGFANMQITGK